MSNVEWSEPQKAQRARFNLANEYVKAMTDPDVHAFYEERTAKKHRVLYRVALTDFYGFFSAKITN